MASLLQLRRRHTMQMIPQKVTAQRAASANCGFLVVVINERFMYSNRKIDSPVESNYCIMRIADEDVMKVK